MGSLISSLASLLFSKREVRLLILGLDNAGKTTILHRLHSSTPVQTLPTIGFEVETVHVKNLKLQVWDLGGQSSIRPYWRCYYAHTNAVIYVVDSNDRERLSDAKHELKMLLGEDDLAGVPVLVFANKQDLPGAMKSAEVAEGIGLAGVKDRAYSIYASSALKGDGIKEGIDWVVDMINSRS